MYEPEIKTASMCLQLTFANTKAVKNDKIAKKQPNKTKIGSLQARKSVSPDINKVTPNDTLSKTSLSQSQKPGAITNKA